MAMMAIKGIYAEYGVQSLNHGIGFDTAAIELLLPTYGERLGLKGRICRHWALNPHPALIPAIEAGWVESVHSFGSELGMEDYVRARPDVFFTGPDGSLRSNRAFCQAAGHYACDLFIGSTLQMDMHGNSSTATLGRIAGFGGAPNMGADARGRRHASAAWLKAGREARDGLPGARGTPRGQKLVVQMVETFREHMQPAFVETLDAWKLAEQAGMPLPPIMIYGDDVTHVLTEEGIANLLLCRDDEEREQAIRGVAGFTPAGQERDRAMVERAARARRHPASGRPRHRPARRHAQPARGALDARPRARVGRAVPAAAALPQLVSAMAGMETLHFDVRRRPRAGAVRAGAGGRRRVGQPRGAGRAGGRYRVPYRRRHLRARLRRRSGRRCCATSTRATALAGLARLHPRHGRDAGRGQPAARPGDRGHRGSARHERQLRRDVGARAPGRASSTPARSTNGCRRPSA